MVAETLWALIIVFAGNDGHGISQPQWGGYHYANALCQWAGREAVKELTESGRSPSEFECIDGYAERERVAVKWRLASPEDLSCNGLTVKQCAQLHKTGCQYNVGPGRPYRTVYSLDREDLEVAFSALDANQRNVAIDEQLRFNMTNGAQCSGKLMVGRENMPLLNAWVNMVTKLGPNYVPGSPL